MGCCGWRPEHGFGRGGSGDHEIVRGARDLRAESLGGVRRIPVQTKNKATRVDVAGQGQDWHTLRPAIPLPKCPASATPAALPVLLVYGHLQPCLDPVRRATVAHAPGHSTQQLGMRYHADVVGPIRVHHLAVPGVQQPMKVPDSVQCSVPKTYCSDCSLPRRSAPAPLPSPSARLDPASTGCQQGKRPTCFLGLSTCRTMTLHGRRGVTLIGTGRSKDMLIQLRISVSSKQSSSIRSDLRSDCLAIKTPVGLPAATPTKRLGAK